MISANSGAALETYTFKILVVGEPGVGKTSLVRRTTKGVFTSQYKTTIGVDFSSKTIKTIYEGEEVEVQLHFWDLAGQERLNNTVRAYYKETDGAFVVCDILNEDTWHHANNWRENVEEKSVRNNGNQNYPPCILLVNKMDLYGHPDFPCWIKNPLDDELFVSSTDNIPSRADKEAQLGYTVAEMAKSAGYLTGYTVSAAKNVGLEEAIEAMISNMIRRRKQDVLEIVDNNHASNGIVRLGGDGFHGSSFDYGYDSNASGQSRAQYYYNSCGKC